MLIISALQPLMPEQNAPLSLLNPLPLPAPSPPPQPLMPEDELICDPAAGWLCSKVDCPVP